MLVEVLGNAEVKVLPGSIRERELGDGVVVVGETERRLAGREVPGSCSIFLFSFGTRGIGTGIFPVV